MQNFKFSQYSFFFFKSTYIKLQLIISYVSSVFANFVSRSVCHFVPDYNILTTVYLIALKYHADIHASIWMNCNIFDSFLIVRYVGL